MLVLRLIEYIVLAIVGLFAMAVSLTLVVAELAWAGLCWLGRVARG